MAEKEICADIHVTALLFLLIAAIMGEEKATPDFDCNSPLVLCNSSHGRGEGRVRRSRNRLLVLNDNNWHFTATVMEADIPVLEVRVTAHSF